MTISFLAVVESIPMAFRKFTEEELRIAKKMYAEDMSPNKIAKFLGRDKSTLTRRLCKRTPLKRQGRKVKVTKSHIDKIEQRLGEMIVKADGQRTVTVADAKRSCRVKACDRTILDKLHERNIYMRIMREKPILTEQDIVERYDFAKEYKGKRASYWTSHIHLHMDCKLFKVCLNQKARS